MSPVEFARKVTEDKERKVPRYHNPLNPAHAHEAELERIDRRLDQAIRNSPPPLDDVGGGVEEMLDEKDPQRLILQRQTTHGDFRDNGRVMQGMKDLARSGPQWEKLTPHQREGVDMILHKVGRIVCGDPNWVDHWDDIAGYAVRVRSFL